MALDQTLLKGSYGMEPFELLQTNEHLRNILIDQISLIIRAGPFLTVHA